MGRFENLEISINKGPEKEDIIKGFDDVYYLKIAKEAQINGFFEAALKYFSRALNYKLEIPEAWAGQVLCLINLGEISEAIVWADKAIEILGEDSLILAAKAMALGRMGEIEKALAISDLSLKKQKNDPLQWLCRGDILIVSNLKTAEFCFKKAMECKKDDAFVFLRIGLSYISISAFSDALYYLNKSYEIFPKSPYINFLLGFLYEKLGIIDRAIRFYKEALRLRPDYKECHEAYLKIKNLCFFKKFLLFFKKFLIKEGKYGKS